MTLDPIVVYSARSSIALLFLAGAAAKLVNFSRFKASVADYQVIGPMAVTPVAVTLAVSEASVAALAWFTLTGALAMKIAIGLLVLYGGVISINLLRGRADLDCGCDNYAQQLPVRWALVVRNGAFAGIAVCGASAPGGGSIGWLEYLTMFMVVVAITALYLGWNAYLAKAAQADEFSEFIDDA